MKIAIVILNWNGKTLLEQFLPSVISYSAEASIYVADNASTDDSIAFLKQEYPQITLIQNKENGGYAKGYNDALQHIVADVFCLLNSDVEVTKDWLVPIIKTFETQPETAIVQPKICDYNHKTHFEYAGAAGGFIDKYGYPFCRGRVFNTLEADTGQYNDEIPIFWASGACLFIRSTVFYNLKGFDASFFAHMEEIDLCWRAKNQNYNIVYNGHATVYHLGGATLKNTNPQKTFLNFRNSLFTLVKNAKGPLFALIVTRLVLDGIAAIKFLFELKVLHVVAIIRAHFSFYSYLPQLIKKRKNSKQSGTYFDRTSIIWDYFVLKKKFY